jgi:hypothetical protein
MVSEKFPDEVKQKFLETNLSTIHETPKQDTLSLNYEKNNGNAMKRVKLQPKDNIFYHKSF